MGRPGQPPMMKSVVLPPPFSSRIGSPNPLFSSSPRFLQPSVHDALVQPDDGPGIADGWCEAWHARHGWADGHDGHAASDGHGRDGHDGHGVRFPFSFLSSLASSFSQYRPDPFRDPSPHPLFSSSMPFMMPQQQGGPMAPNAAGSVSPASISAISATPMRQTGSRSPNTAATGGPAGGQGQQQGPGPARSNTRGQSHFKPY